MEKYRNLLTIVLALKDRSDFTYRYMKWMNENKCSYKILIADGGKDKEIEKHLKNYGNYSDLDYEYIRYPYDKDLNTYHKKIYDISLKVETKYVLYTDNDDFLILDYLKDKISFLEMNKEYSCSTSRLNYFTVLKKDTNCTINDCLYGGDMVLKYYGINISSIDQDKSSNRVMKVLNNRDWGSIWYGVIKTNLSVLANKQIYDSKLYNVATSEYYIALTLSIFGKIAIDDKMHYFKQNNTSQTGTDDNFIGSKDFILSMLKLEWQYDYSKMIKCTINNLKEKEPNYQDDLFLSNFIQEYKKHIMPMITYPQRHNKSNFFKIKVIILNSYFLSKITFFIEKLLKIKIMPTSDIRSLKHEESISKMISFMRENENKTTST